MEYSVERSVSSDTQLVEADTRSVPPTVELGTQRFESVEAGTVQHLLLDAELLKSGSNDFEIVSPIRPRRRPKQKAKVKKTQRDMSTQMANGASSLMDKQLSLATIPNLL